MNECLKAIAALQKQQTFPGVLSLARLRCFHLDFAQNQV
jgi:hypothetical protein